MKARFNKEISSDAKIVDIIFDKDYNRNGKVGRLTVLVDTKIPVHWFDGIINRRTQILFGELKAKYNYEPGTEWTLGDHLLGYTGSNVFYWNIESASSYYLADLCLPIVKKLLMEKCDNA